MLIIQATEGRKKVCGVVQIKIVLPANFEGFLLGHVEADRRR